MFSALAEGHGDLKDKINIFIALCPITNLGFASAGFMDFGRKWYTTLKNTLSTFSIYEILGPTWTTIGKTMCLTFPCGIFDSLAKATAHSFNDPRAVEATNERESSSASSK